MRWIHQWASDRPRTADDLRKCLAFDAITACRVFDLQRLARDRPDAPATDLVSEDEGCILYVDLLELQVIRARPPPGRTTIGEFVIGVAGLAGFHPPKGPAAARGAETVGGIRHTETLAQYIPGTEKVDGA